MSIDRAEDRKPAVDARIVEIVRAKLEAEPDTELLVRMIGLDALGEPGLENLRVC